MIYFSNFDAGGFGGAQYWRLRFPDGSVTDDFLAIPELQLRSTVGGARQDTSGGGTASSQGGAGFDPAKAFDGNTSSEWSTASGQTVNSWLANNLGSVKDIAELSIFGSTTTNWGPQSIVVEHSPDGSVWTQDTRWPTLSSLVWAANETRRIPRADQVGSRIIRSKSIPLADFSPSWTNLTFRQTIAPSLFPIGGAKIKLGWRSGNAQGMTINKAYVGVKGAGALDFATTPSQVTFSGGSASIAVGINTDIVSDEITMAATEGDTLIVSWFCPSGASAADDLRRQNGGATGGYKTGDSAASVTTSGTTAYNHNHVNLVESYSAPF